MPGYDGKGPEGEGPMTGGRSGYCSSTDQPEGDLIKYGLGRGGLPRGGGRGMGRGRGFGRGYANNRAPIVQDKLRRPLGKLEKFLDNQK